MRDTIVNLDLTAYITLICTSGVLNLYLCFYVFIKRHHYANIAHLFILHTGFTSIYCMGAAFSLLSVNLGEMKFWTAIQYVGMPFSPPAGLLFVMQYVGIKVRKKHIFALFIIPFISLIMVATNDWHHLHYRVFEIDPVLGAPYVHQEIGPWYTIHGMFIFSSMFVAFLLAVYRWKETAKAYRLQLISLMVGQLVPIVTAFIYLMGFTPQGIDPVPMVLWVSSFLYLWSINSSRMFTVMPVAKDAIFNSINDGVVVLDESYRLIEFNLASKNMFPQLKKSMLGKHFADIWVTLSGRSFPFALENTKSSHELELFSEDQSSYTYQVRTSPLQYANNSHGLLLIFTDITELKRLQLKLENQAYYDELTQIYNRRAFFQHSKQAFDEAKKSASSFTLLLLDIDYFKKVNDTYGHYAGDQVLVHVVKACESALPQGALFARYGGEEFVLALKGHTLSEGETLADQIRRHVETQPLLINEKTISVTLSLGVAQAEKQENETLDELLNKADIALYAAKQHGRNQVRVYKEIKEILERT